MTTETPLSIDSLRPQFEALLRAHNTSLQAPALGAAWRAFVAFCQIAVACDEESLFFECGLSPSIEGRFYVNFTRTFIGRDAGNHFWSCEVNCDFLFQSDEQLEELGQTIEAEVETPADCAAFTRAVEAHAVWRLLENRAPLQSTIYIGES